MPPAIDTSRPTDLLHAHEGKPEGSFLHRLTAETWHALLQVGLRSRAFARDELLPMGPNHDSVYIILEGVVRQDRYPLGTGVASPGHQVQRSYQLVGEAALIQPGASVDTRCLTSTVVIPCSARYFNVLTERRLPEARLALLRSLEDRIRSDEVIYGMAIRPPLERVSRLLAHLADTVGVPDPRTSQYSVITGPGQKDIAAALQLAVSTTENALRTLRYHGVLEARYRQFVIHDVDGLRHLAGA
ncbi:Crp/Fnr family transcriptional regulator [Streptomyces coeruleorubidus]|uniref:Crp/Fnr family transcriptional regulator n=1 Tax=Streptomyces coeruleorubidus TaxID=116188 RepID=A0ABZ0KSA6_STRC4|nr:Crp/Fnr family transcriptional regulator [Streptomyces coeruleorubidus]WOT40736.1 Crp/Fnr family transcriptional regulator [Streptomyces coeruleorubidus]